MSDESAVFVDTDVLVYAFDDSDSVRQAVAERALTELMESDKLRLSTQVLQEFYVAVTGRVGNPLSPSVALSVTEELSAWPVLVVDYGLVRESILMSKNQPLSFWDSLVVTSAARSGAHTLFSEALTPGQALLGVQIVNPFHQ
jgi:predicted nucleic acid-binding protein